jgi:hypothetical protein
MIEQDEQLQTLHEIRSIMDRSTRFQSLSGLSGIFVGFIALAGAGAVQWHLSLRGLSYPGIIRGELTGTTAWFIGTAAAVIFVLAVSCALYFTSLKARKARQSVWSSQARRLLFHFCLPLAVGGAFCGVLLYHAIGYLIAPAMLIFYGLALVNASKYTFGDLLSLGVCEIALGLVCCVRIEYGLLVWALGFGLLHMVYGGILYFKYEKKTATWG